MWTELLELVLGGGKPREAKVAVLGLDNAGKSTIVNALSGRSDRKVIPTVGVNTERVISTVGLDVKVADLGGSASFRPSWKAKLARSHAAIFVVDASDSKRLLEVRDEFLNFIANADVAGKPVLVLSNKTDASVVPVVELIKVLRLQDPSTLKSSQWRVIPCTGAKAAHGDVVDDRLMDGVRWLAHEVHKKWQPLRKRVDADSKALDARDHAKRLENKRSVAAKKKAAKGRGVPSSVSKSKVVPEEAALQAPIVFCKKMLVQGEQRVPCTNEASKRSSVTGWVPYCESCFNAALAEVPQSADADAEGAPAVSRLEAVARQDAAPQVSRLEAFAKGGSPGASPAKDRALGIGGSAASASALAQHGLSEKEARRKAKKDKKERKRKKKLAKRYRAVIFANGEAVEANFSGKGAWYGGKVTWTNPDGTLNITYDDGDAEEGVEPWNVAPQHGPPIAAGTRVDARFRGKAQVFAGSVQGINEDGQTYTVAFDDGDVDRNAQRAWIRVVDNE